MAWRLFIILMNNIEMGDFPIDLIYLSQHNASPIKMQFIVQFDRLDFKGSNDQPHGLKNVLMEFSRTNHLSHPKYTFVLDPRYILIHLSFIVINATLLCCLAKKVNQMTCESMPHSHGRRQNMVFRGQMNLKSIWTLDPIKCICFTFSPPWCEWLNVGLNCVIILLL